MKTKVELSTAVLAFVRTLAPEPRKAIRDALRKLEQGKGDIKALHAELTGFWRLRVGAYRIVFHYEVHRGVRYVRCDYAEHRSIIYEVFSEMVVDRLKRSR